jgi:hypothetical protein
MLVRIIFWQHLPVGNIFGKHLYYLVKILGKVGQNMTTPPPPMLMSSRRPCPRENIFSEELVKQLVYDKI